MNTVISIEVNGVGMVGVVKAPTSSSVVPSLKATIVKSSSTATSSLGDQLGPPAQL